MRMGHSHFTRKFFFATILAWVGFASLAATSDVNLGGKLSAANEVPANASGGSGTVEASLNPQTKQLKWRVAYSGTTGPVTAAHFHGPAASGQNAGVVLGFKGDLESPIVGEATITPEQAADVLAGKWYVNLHTKANPGGEIRLQLTPQN
ncbi:MAG: CHRD domain-containing protein [Betaproteobacteria bacterium]